MAAADEGLGLTAAELEALEVHPDVHALFRHYNSTYFEECLGACSVEWSTKRMTLCAGMCHFQRGGGCRIKLSEPLLKFRPACDLKDTLLHEMIHAELFLKGVRDDGDHGKVFRSRMEAINKATCSDPQRPADGYNITVFHTMHDEVNVYRTHVWECSRCGNTVKRSMNRPPQEADCRAFTKAAAAAAAAAGMPGAYCKDARCWYHLHLKQCGGQYKKIQEPEKPQPAAAVKAGHGSSAAGGGEKRSKQSAAGAAAPAGMQLIAAFFKPQQQKQQGSSHVQQPQQQAGHSQPPSLQQQQQAAALQQQGQRYERKQQQQQQQPVQEYFASLGKGRVLGGSSATTHGAGGIRLGRGAVVVGVQGQQQEPLVVQQPRSVLPQQQKQQLQSHPHHQRQQQQQQHGLQLHKEQSTARPPEVVELLSSDDEGDQQQQQQQQQSPQSSQAGHKLADAAGAGASAVALPAATRSMPAVAASQAAGAVAGAAEGTLNCPVCCQQWLPGEVSNAQLNAHLDECLVRLGHRHQTWS